MIVLSCEVVSGVELIEPDVEGTAGIWTIEAVGFCGFRISLCGLRVKVWPFFVLVEDLDLVGEATD